MCAVSSVYAYGLAPSDQRSFVASTATNLVNLRTDPLGTLIASAFVSEATPWIWIGFGIVGLFPLVHRFGNLRALLLVGAAQVIGTVISEGLLAWQISTGAAPYSRMKTKPPPRCRCVRRPSTRGIAAARVPTKPRRP